MAPEAISSPDALKQEQRRIRRGTAYAFLVSAVVLGGAHLLLPPLVIEAGGSLEGRLMFWAGANLFVLLWIVIGVGMVSTGRRYSAEDIRGAAYAPPSAKIAIAVAFLQNTLEQGVITAFALLSLVLLLGTTALPIVAGSALLFSVGRVAFLAGYPKGAGARSFGMALTALPSLFAFVLSAITAIRFATG
jgi:uncharacterized MAPEG superfamily protein